MGFEVTAETGEWHTALEDFSLYVCVHSCPYVCLCYIFLFQVRIHRSASLVVCGRARQEHMMVKGCTPEG